MVGLMREKYMNVEKLLITKAKEKFKTIVYPEADFSPRIIEATKIVAKNKIANVILIGDESSLVLKYGKLDNMQVINPKTSELTNVLAEKFYELRKNKGISLEEANEKMLDPFYFSTMLVQAGYADGMVGGAEVSTARNLKPALEVIKGKSGLVSSCFMFYGKNKFMKNRPFFLADAGLVENPTSEGLAEIASQTVKSANDFIGLNPKLAFLSYSSKGSAKGESIDKVRIACEIFKSKNPNILADGELQLDASLVPEVAKRKAPNSEIKGEANILLVPDINAGNIVYKAIQYFGGLNAIGPITQGFNKPINDLSRGCNVKDIIILTAITAIQCE